MFNEFYNKLIFNLMLENNIKDLYDESKFKSVVNDVKKFIETLSSDTNQQKQLLEQAIAKCDTDDYQPNSDSNDDVDKIIYKTVELSDKKVEELLGYASKFAFTSNKKLFTKRPELFKSLYAPNIVKILKNVVKLYDGDGDVDDDSGDDEDNINQSQIPNSYTISTAINNIVTLIKKLNNGEISENGNYINRVIELIKQLNNGEDSGGVSDMWTLKCFKKRSPYTSNKDYVCDLYRPVNEQVAAKLKEVLGIDYFAFEYTSAEPNTMERVMKMPWDANKYTKMISCRFMAFDENHKPLTEYGVANVHLNRGKDKTTFILKGEGIPHIATPHQQVTNKQFIDIIKQSLPDDIKEAIQPISTLYDDALNAVYESLKTEQTNNGISLADLLVAQYIYKVNMVTSKLNEFFGSIVGDLVKIIQEINGIASENNNQQPQQPQQPQQQ